MSGSFVNILLAGCLVCGRKTECVINSRRGRSFIIREKVKRHTPHTRDQATTGIAIAIAKSKELRMFESCKRVKA